MRRIRSLSLFEIINYAFFGIASILFIIPLWSIIAISISRQADIAIKGYRLLPIHLDMSAYSFIFSTPATLLNAYKVTIISSAVGTLLSVLIISMCAYALSRRDFSLRRSITFLLFFTMLFNGGLVPTYILMTNYLHLQNTYGALLLPLMGSVWFLLLMRSFFQELPSALIESATIDGAGEFKIYTRIILPISTPVIATITLLQLLQYWNSWFPALLYVSDQHMYPLQYLLQTTLRNVEDILKNMAQGLPVGSNDIKNLPSESLRMAMVVLAAGPMLVVFPFFQKYFAKGITVGSVK